jgi:hypothetical protein
MKSNVQQQWLEVVNNNPGNSRCYNSKWYILWPAAFGTVPLLICFGQIKRLVGMRDSSSHHRYRTAGMGGASWSGRRVRWTRKAQAGMSWGDRRLMSLPNRIELFTLLAPEMDTY